MEKVTGLIVVFILLSQLQLGIAYKLICYFTNWAQYRPGIAKFMPENIPPCLCSHLIYAFAIINNKHNVVTKEKNDVALYTKFNGLKKKNPNLKTLLAIAGFDPRRFNKTIAVKLNRATFIKSAILFVRKYNFDGLDIIWDQPDSSHSGNKKKFTVLLKEFKQTLKTDAKRSGKARLLLTAALPANKDKIDAGFEVKQIAQYLDFIHVMTYDFHGSWNSFTGHNSPLYIASPERLKSAISSMDSAAKYWTTNGLPADKIIIGFPTYGRTFTLKTFSNHSVGAPAVGPGPPGIYTKDPGYWAYYEVCDFLKNAKIEMIQEQKVPYASYGKVWLGYDDINSFETKVQWMKDNKFGGVFVWTIDLDDLHNHCRKGVLPLTNKLHRLLDINPNCHKAAVISNLISHSGGVIEDVDEAWCRNKMLGVYPDPKDTSKFYQCAVIGIHEHCPRKQVYDQSCMCCTWPQSKGVYDPHWCHHLFDGFHPDLNDVTKFYVCIQHKTFWKECPKGLVFNTACKCCKWTLTRRRVQNDDDHSS
ncbi:chitotriosidase-1-like isoform X1 [Scyliorhinus canicula]|uniref:chitotriosidase-1-like isoform X1 n=1 Tax=Scyliorhinus canicula TaxID=7830 RepID=UPI0018F3B94A|nr:chitotriosidase-1-like isoform X1 [Scyliorhinus canicula]